MATTLHQSHSQQIIFENPKKDSIRKYDLYKTSNIKSPTSSLFINYGYIKDTNKLSRNINKRLTSISLIENKTKYANFYIFSKRENAFHQSMQNNKKVFKYQNFSLFEEKGKTTSNKIRRNKINNNNLNNNKSSSLYLTQNILRENKSMLPFISNEKSIIKDFDANKTFIDKDDNRQKITTSTNYITVIKDNNFLNKIIDKSEQERISKSKEEKKRNKVILKKIDIYNRCNSKDILKSKFIENMREFLLEKYNIQIKQEKTKIFQENIKDKIEFINDRIKILKNEFNIFNDRFVTKFSEYIKQVIQMKDIEKNKDNLYLNYIFQLKKEIVSLNLRNKKIKNDRDGLNRWMYLQICVKEKKKVLPKYYKIILEDKQDENKEELKKIDKNLINNVLKYKNNIIYKNGDLFLEQIKKYENQNIDLLTYYNLLREEIDELNKEKELLLIENNQKEMEKEEDKLIAIKLKVLLNTKNKYNKLTQYWQSVKSLIDSNDEDDEEFVNKKYTKLYYKTSKLLNNLNSHINYDFQKIGIVKSYKNITEESLILLNLTKIEILTDIFIAKNTSFKKNFSDKMNNFQTLLDKNKKLKKNIEQRKNIKLKLERERDKIFKKYNKIIILPTHKLNINNVLTKKLILKKYREQKKNREEIIDDYLYD
jgi:hypothetical protein